MADEWMDDLCGWTGWGVMRVRTTVYVVGLLTGLVSLQIPVLGADSATTGEAKTVETSPEDPLVQVNEHVITRQELESHVRLFLRSRPAAQSRELLPPLEDEQVQASARRNALEDLIERRLLIAEAKRSLFTNEGAEEAFKEFADEHIEGVIEGFGSPITFHRLLSATGVSREQFCKMREESLLIGHLIHARIEPSVFVCPREIREYYQQHLEEFRVPRKIVFRQLWVDPLGLEDRTQELEKAQEILQRLREGEDFGRLADECSLDRLRYPGGLREAQGWGELHGWLRDALAALEPGEVSGIQDTTVGYCVVKLEEVVEPHMRSLKEVSDEIRQKLHQQKVDQARRKLVEQLRAKAYIRRFPAAEEIAR